MNVFNLFPRDPETVVNYIIWTVIHQFIKVMPQAYRDAYNDYIVTVTGNRTEDRWIECINGMQAVFAMPLGLLFVDAAFDERSKTVVRELNRGTCNFANSILNHSSFKLYVYANGRVLGYLKL